MQKDNLIKDKTFDFALLIIELYTICKAQNEYVIAKQLLRSGTSIGANVQEAIAGYSEKDFLHKIAATRITFRHFRNIKASMSYVTTPATAHFHLA